MSVYCQYCGKVLTTGDRIDRCFPNCQERLNQPMVVNILDDVRQERDQLRAENERLRDLILAYENDLVLLSVYGKLKRAEAEIKESNDLLRSAWMIAKRDGNETNWEAWRKQLDIALARQHTMMYGDSEQALNEVEKC